MTGLSPSSTGTAEAIRIMTLWFEQQIENAQQDQISGFAGGTAAGTLRGERAHARHCAMFEAKQVFLAEMGSVDAAQAEPGPMVPWELKCLREVCAAPECDCPPVQDAGRGESWEPIDFWKFVSGLAGEFEADQMRDTLAERGLQIVGISDPAYSSPERGNRFCKHDDCPYPDCLVGGICPSQPSSVPSTHGDAT